MALNACLWLLYLASGSIAQATTSAVARPKMPPASSMAHMSTANSQKGRGSLISDSGDAARKRVTKQFSDTGK